MKRAANSQKCIRAGGKHNDLEDVGKDVYHHTFFEMLGNWSFGDYFKREAISMAWDLLTRVWCLPKERLYVTYFRGNPELNLPADEEAKHLWIEVGMPPERVLPYGMKENFWEMGETGPCGPCSEIHFDRIGGGRDASQLVNADDPDVLEIWNLVFMQFNREADGSLRPLPNKHVDTGAGLERVTSVLQCKRSNYDTDIFTGLFQLIQERSGCRPYTGLVGADDKDGVDMAYRVVADHIRTLTVALADGGVPSNDGRGYVLRRILRRAVRYSHDFLCKREGFFAELVEGVVASLGEAFPEIGRRVQDCKAIIMEEEAQFNKTLERGLAQFQRFVREAKDPKVFPGDLAWLLYDTYGFPADLTRLMAEERGMRIDEPAFLQAQAKARELSKQRAEGDQGHGVLIDVHLMAELEAAGIKPTDDQAKYSSDSIEAKVTALLQGGKLVDETTPSGFIGVLLDRTCLYAEQGGQQADTGSLIVSGQVLPVVDVQLYGGHVLHVCQATNALKVGAEVKASFDAQRRQALRLNHTATHILNHALRAVLGEGIEQQGSLVAADRLRFDYSAKSQPTTEELARIQGHVQRVIKEDQPVQWRVLPLTQAKGLAGLRAVFGEVYPDPVRVVAVGLADFDAALSDPLNARWLAASLELCGGTHAQRSSELGDFLVIGEQAISKGTRRLIGITGEAAKEARTLESQLGKQVDAATDDDLRTLPRIIDEAAISLLVKQELRDRLQVLKGRQAEAEKAQKAAQSKVVLDAVKAHLEANPVAQSQPLVLGFAVGDNGKALLSGLNALKDAQQPALLYSCHADRVIFHALVPDQLTASLSAVQLCQSFGEVLERKGLITPGSAKCGGRPAAAQGSAQLTVVADLSSQLNNLSL